MFVHEVGAPARDRSVAPPEERRAPLWRRDGDALGRGRAGARRSGSRFSRAGRRSRASTSTTRRATLATTCSTTTPSPATPTRATSPACSVPPSDLAAAPTPPPEIEVEVWLESLQMLRSLEPKRICMTHFGWKDDAEGQIARVEAWLKDAAEESSHDDPRSLRGVAPCALRRRGRGDRRAPAPGDAARSALAGARALLAKAPRGDRRSRKPVEAAAGASLPDRIFRCR